MAHSGAGHMLCPACHIDLVISTRQGVEIDYCPQCRGVWLDRGELDKIIERQTNGSTDGAAHSPVAPRNYRPDRRPDSAGGRSSADKRDSWLKDLFD